MNHKYSKFNKPVSDMTKIANFYNAVNSVIIEDVNYREIFDNAVQFEYGGALNEYSENAINAIIVNDIRHNYSNYEQFLSKVNRINRSNNDYIQYKNSVLEKIANVYPSLKNECNKQKREFDMVKICKQR